MSKQPAVVTHNSTEKLNVTGAEVRFLCRGEQTGAAWSLMETVLPRYAGPPPHHHPWDECYYVVEGRVRFHLDGRDVLVGAGDFVYAPGGTLHGFAGDSDSPARMLVFDAPAHTEGFFRDTDREVKELPRDVPTLMAIGERYGIQFPRR
jgi:quercetin dioxygenase-like cupin family protein